MSAKGKPQMMSFPTALVTASAAMLFAHTQVHESPSSCAFNLDIMQIQSVSVIKIDLNIILDVMSRFSWVLLQPDILQLLLLNKFDCLKCTCTPEEQAENGPRGVSVVLNVFESLNLWVESLTGLNFHLKDECLKYQIPAGKYILFRTF